ncbi:rhomboid family intramembrane serine protease [Ornithinibacillus halophilus]|uniref:Membrane associated serine protease, rhomboid family n=1 Tax=Ornithinibacillus halophilus TaxID=930117 RepID=A0A1M5IUX7_9BACI|nr:rhomboid family intramembrane serine protease [Ornithinibacillus halophilus]SHG32142.1 Membrane associated serine protease, rhomboid family [Ornithinibacillus halophilus]
MFIRTEKSIKEFMHYYPIVSGLIIIHLALWLLDFFLPVNIWGGGNTYLVSEGQYWRLVTPIFLHVDLMHALFNSFALVLFGPALEQMLGKGKFLFAYLGAGIIGNLGTQLIEGSTWYGHVGASGAIYGLFGIYVFMVVFRKDLIDQANAQIVVTIFIIGLIMTFLTDRINQSGHVFGFIGGFALAPIVLSKARAFSHWRNRRRVDDDQISFDPNRWNKRRVPKNFKKNILWIVLGGLVLIGLLARFL